MEKNDIIIIHGTNYKEMAVQVLEKAGLADLIGSRDKSVRSEEHTSELQSH